MDNVTLTIDGRRVTVEKGKTVLEAAIGIGISVPYYCYHPAISIDGLGRYSVSSTKFDGVQDQVFKRRDLLS